jgi:hypothetical protein
MWQHAQGAKCAPPCVRLPRSSPDRACLLMVRSPIAGS